MAAPLVVLAGCAGPRSSPAPEAANASLVNGPFPDPSAVPSPNPPLANNTTDDPSTPTRTWQHNYTVTVSRAGGPAPQQLTGHRNCAFLRTGSATHVWGNATAAWNSSNPAAQELGLYAHFEKRPRELAAAEGASPITLRVSLDAPDDVDRLVVFVDVPPGRPGFALRETLTIGLILRYEGAALVEGGTGVCEVPGA